MSTHTALLSFNNGEVSPYLRRRTDYAKTPDSSEVMRNFLPLPFGAATKRPGIVDLAETEVAGMDSKAFAFTASDGTGYIIHLTGGEEPMLTIYHKDGTVADSLPFFPTYAWPEEFTWSRTIREFQMENVNDVAFLTHPRIHPLRLTRNSDSNWSLPFIPFSSAPMLDENLDENRLLSVVSNPEAPAWADGEDYNAGDVVFASLSEWEATDTHTADSDNEPAAGDDWRKYWVRKFYQEGDAITITAKDKKAPAAWSELFVSYLVGSTRIRYTDSPPWVDDVTYGAYCAVAHTTEAGTSYSGETSNTYPPAGDDKWVTVSPWELEATNPAAFYSVGELGYRSGRIWQCIVGHAPDGAGPDADPGTGVDTALFWIDLAAMPATPGVWSLSDSYITGTRVSRLGHTYECTADHVPVAATTRPGSGSDWMDYWAEVSEFLPSFDISDVSPGTYWRLSPERDDKDFQLEMRAIEANDGLFSDRIAVDGGWNIYTYGVWTGTFIVQKSTDNAATWDTIRSYQATDDRNVSDKGFEDTPCLLRLGFIKETGTDSGGKQRAILIPETNYVTGEALMTEYVDADEMRGFAKTAMLSGSTFRWAQGAFSEENGFPRALCLHESRLCFGGTIANPVSIWISASDDFQNFEAGTEDDDALFETLPTGNQSPIRWMASQRRLFLGTSLSEWVVGSDTVDAPLTPDNYFVRAYTATGSDVLPPVRATSGLLFPGRKGGRLYELQYTTEQGYEATDLSRLAEHLTRAGITSMAWQQTREPGLWAVTREGGLLHFAYSRSERIFAWSRHDTEGGLFRDVVVFPSDEGDDEVFFIIDRDESSFLCRLPQHWQYLQETGSPVDYTDGEAESPIVSELVSLPIDMQADTGTTQARMKRQHKLCLDLYQSRGGHLWNRDISRKQPIAGAQAALTTGWTESIPDAGSQDDAQLKIYHADPYPFTLRSAVIRWNLNEP